MMILALDLGKFNTMCCLFDSETRKHEFIVAETQREYLAKIFKLKNVDVVVMEACGPCGWALKLARLYILDELKCVHVPSKEHREFRLLVKNRKSIDYRITRVKNCIRSIFVNQGVSIARGSAAWTKAGRKLTCSHEAEQSSRKSLRYFSCESRKPCAADRSGFPATKMRRARDRKITGELAT